jgi:hypothetical protein
VQSAVPLAITAAEIVQLPDADLPAGHALHYIAARAHLPDGLLDVTPLLFPAPASRDKTSSAGRTVGFDAEWRAHLGRREAPGGWSAPRDSPAAPATVVQLSSELATVVVNLYALGTDMGGGSGSVTDACTAALVVAQPVFANSDMLKVGLHCQEDVARLKQLCSTFAASKVVDCQVCTHAQDQAPLPFVSSLTLCTMPHCMSTQLPQATPCC